MLRQLASYRRLIERVRQNWPVFAERHRQWLKQQERHGVAAEKVTENIVQELFTLVLDWEIADLNHQVGHADLLLTRLGIKYLIVEAKRPGALAWNRRAVEAALDQACRYAAEQKVRCVGVSDGIMFYAADVHPEGLRDRVFVSLDAAEPDESLWWVSVHGIYRRRHDSENARLRLLPEAEAAGGGPELPTDADLLHPKYRLPARCFAYVGNPADPKTWKLPYRLADGTVDAKRLPKAIQAIVSNYRGARASGIDERAVPEVLGTLARAAASLGKMPHQTGKPAPVYVHLAQALEQFGRLNDIVNES